MSEIRMLREGMLVRHMTKKYIGFYEGVTRITKLFELPSDSIGCRVRIGGRLSSKIEIASPDNLETLDSLNLEERHEAHLEFLGIPWKGIREAGSSNDRRVTHCWFCKSKLDNAVNSECNACGWILCGNCGACGCGYK